VSTTIEESTATDVESLVVAFSVEAPELHAVNKAAKVKTKNNFFIFVGFVLCLQLTYEDLRFFISLFIR
jgi:hypothetical protein